VPFVDQYLEYLVKRGLHAGELSGFFHRVGYDHFWMERKDAVQARKYLEMGLRIAPNDTRLAGDLAAVN
jgi:hypothetical protein